MPGRSEAVAPPGRRSVAGRLGWAVPVVLAFLIGAAIPERAAAADLGDAHVPVMFDPDHRPAAADRDAIKTIRFLTTDDFPPFHFTLPDGSVGGFDVDLARAICRDLKLACTIQSRRYDTLVPELVAGKDDAIIAALANTAATRETVAFTDPYYTNPARFVGRVTTGAAGSDGVSAPQKPITPEALKGRTIGVEAGSAHEAFLKAFFAGSTIKAYRNQPDLLAALRQSEIDLAFGDGIALAIWLSGPEPRGCCAFRGGPFTESRYFGNGVSIAVGKNNEALRQLLNDELAKLTRDGTYADLFLKYFPISFY